MTTIFFETNHYLATVIIHMESRMCCVRKDETAHIVIFGPLRICPSADELRRLVQDLIDEGLQLWIGEHFHPGPPFVGPADDFSYLIHHVAIPAVMCNHLRYLPQHREQRAPMKLCQRSIQTMDTPTSHDTHLGACFTNPFDKYAQIGLHFLNLCVDVFFNETTT